MGKSPSPEPRLYPGVMVSSTFKDLEQHRAALMRAIDGQELKHIAMEDDSAKPDVDVIESSLHKVQNSSAYIGVISHKYGQTPKSPDSNPDELSLTELEFNQAQRLRRPILLFIMGDDHPVRKGEVEIDPAKIKKLEAFHERAKRIRPDSAVHRVYAEFNSLEEFTAKAIQSVAELRRFLEQSASKSQSEARGIFINYRRDDSIGYAGRVYDRISAQFEKECVFMDIDTISPGDDFRRTIEQTCASSDVVLALIAKSWATVVDKNGRRRIDNPCDLVRLELAQALTLGIRVIPVLLDDAEMPDSESLPDDLKDLAYRQAMRISSVRFHSDIDRLIEAIKFV